MVVTPPARTQSTLVKTKTQYIAYAFIVVTPLIALAPLMRVAIDWIEMARVVPFASFEPVEHGYDWVEWRETEGLIRAGFVFPNGPAARAGILPGDVFHELDYRQYFTVEDLQQAIEGVQAGTSGVYTVMRGDALLEVAVPFSRDPTFLYPLAGALWKYSLWGFSIGAFFHLLGLTIVAPLASRSRRARFSLVLIAVSSLWIIGNLVRLVVLEIAGPPLVPESAYDVAFQSLTFLGLAGWLAFPALLFHKVVLDAGLLDGRRLGPASAILYLPAAILAVAALVATVSGRIGPLTLNALATTILFYACTYIAGAAALTFIAYLIRPQHAQEVLGRWNRAGSTVTLVIAVVAALAVLGLILVRPAVDDVVAGWFIVSAQLLSVAPVVLVSHATWQYGKVDLIVSRWIVYLTLLGALFFAFVGGMTLLQPYTAESNVSATVVGGLYVVALLLVFGRLARAVDFYATSLFASERRRAQRVISTFVDRMRSLVDHESLARESAEALTRGLDSRFCAVFIWPEEDGRRLVSGVYHPEPPFVTQRYMSLIWPYFQDDNAIWARNNELRERKLPPEIVVMLRARGVAVAAPVTGGGKPSGIILLGEKRGRRSVYNLEDVDLVRTFSRQLALSVERLRLVERERSLVRESVESNLVALRAQINPHFLFNALNTIAALISEHPREAEDTVERVAAIFRHTLQAGSRAFVSLQDELDLVSQYLNIEKARFGEKLEIEIACEAGLDAVPVPAFAVQTLVENAVKHGVERSRDGGSVRIHCRRLRGFVEIEVCDTGVGIASLFGTVKADTSFYGVGLKNVAARLELLYDRDDLLRIMSDPLTGTVATLRIPGTTGGPVATTGREQPALITTNRSHGDVFTEPADH